MPFRGQRQSPRRRQRDIVENAGNQHRRPRPDPLLQNPERLTGIGRFDDHEVTGAKAERFKTVDAGSAVFAAQTT